MPTVRPATTDDGPFLSEMLAIAVDWRQDADVRPVAAVMAEPALAHYIAGWGRDGDVGFVVEQDGPVGATWWRFFPEDDPGYGFVDETIPELSIGVVATARRKGLGTLLLEALVAEARRRSLAALSLSVEPENPAAALYRRFGFVTVGSVEGSLTMLLQLDR